LYDIRPRNGAGLFLQPGSPHGALVVLDTYCYGVLFTYDLTDDWLRAVDEVAVQNDWWCVVCRQVLEVLSAVRGEDQVQLAETIYRNTCNLFRFS